MPDNQLRNGLAEHRTLSRAAFSAFDGESNKSSAVGLEAGYKPECELKFKAGRFFRKIVADADVGHFVATDEPMLVEYCVLLAKLDDHRKEFRRAKLTIPAGRGQVKSNPIVVEYTKLQQQAIVLATKLRLQPQARRKTAVHGEHRRPEAPSPEKEQEAPATDLTPSRAGLMFGGARARAAVNDA